MFTPKRIKTLAGITIIAMGVPVLLGAGCPAAQTTLLSSTNSASSPPPLINNSCVFPSAGFQTGFTAGSGRLVTATVTGPTSDSRPQIIIQDSNSNEVANSGAIPTDNGAQTSFTPSSSQTFTLTVIECSAGISGSYTVLVTQNL